MSWISSTVILSILIISGLQVVSTRDAPDFGEVESFVKDIISEIPVPFVKQALTLWNWVERTFTTFKGQSTGSAAEERHKVLLENLRKIGTSVHQVNINLDDRLDAMTALSDFKRYRDKYQDAVSEVLSRRYQQFWNIISSNLTREDETKRKNFYDVLLTGHNPLQTLLDDVHRTFYGYVGVFPNSLLAFIKNNGYHYNDFMCLEGQSMHQLIYYYFQIILECEVKGYMMVVYATSPKNATESNGNNADQVSALEQAAKRIYNLVNTTTQFLSVMPRQLWSCNLKNSIEEKDHVKIGPIFQKYVLRENDLLTPQEDERLNELARQGNTNIYEIDTVTHYSWRSGFIRECWEQRNFEEYSCKNVLRDCEPQITVYTEYCPLKRNHTSGKHKRYQYVNIDNTLTYGKKCNETEDTPWGVVKVGWDWGYSLGSHICTCIDDSKDILRYVHAGWVTADRDNVITGVKIVPVNNTLYLQIKQGKLLPNMAVTSADWKNISYLKSEVYDDVDKYPMEIINLSYGKTRIFLDDAETARKDQVLTGIRFSPMDRGFRIDAAYSFFNYSDGKLMNHHDLPESKKDCYTKQEFECFRNFSSTPICQVIMDDLCKFQNAGHYSDSHMKNRKKVDVNDLDIPNNPEKLHHNHEVSNVNREYVDLTQTSKELDFGQNILPFIDIQEVVSNPPTPLSGVGLFRRASEDSAGYLALKLITFDYNTILKKTTENENTVKLPDVDHFHL